MARQLSQLAVPPDIDGQPPTAEKDHRGAAFWWRLRSWKKDMDVLARVRQGIEALPDELDDAGLVALPPEVPRPDRRRHAGAHRSGQRAGASPADSAGPAALARPPASAGAARPVSSGPDPGMTAIRETFAVAAAAGDSVASYFYGYLFAHHPKLRELFPPAMDEQRDRLFHALSRIVESLNTPEEMGAYLGQLGRDHRKYGVEPAMYEAVGAALIAALRAFAGAAFTPEAEAAWTEVYTAGSAIMIRAAEDDSAGAPAYWPAEVVDHEIRQQGIAVLTVAPDEVLPFEAGQHITVQTPRWPRVWRPYSIACRPREDGLIRLHVKAVPGGWVSNALVAHAAPGDQLTLGPALGTMTLRPSAGRDLLCVAGGTGLSPIKAIIEQAIRDATARHRRRIFLFYGARTRDELYDLRDLWRLSDAYSDFQMTPVTSDDPAFDGMQGNVGRVAARYMPHQDCEAYVAGPSAMVRESVRVIARAGIPTDRIHYDDALLTGRSRVGTGT